MNPHPPSPHPRKDHVTIIVNGRRFEVHRGRISFEEVVRLAFPTPPGGGNTIFTVTFKGGCGDRPQGTMVEGDTVTVREGMVFNVTATDKS